MRDLLDNHAEEDIKADVDSIKLNFYKRHRAQADEGKEELWKMVVLKKILKRRIRHTKMTCEIC